MTRIKPEITRRTLLKSAAGAAVLTTTGGVFMPYISRAADRPVLTYGIQSGVYIKAPSKEQGQNLPPSDGYQFFGHVHADGKTGQLTVTLRDAADAALWSKTLDPLPV